MSTSVRSTSTPASAHSANSRRSPVRLTARKRTENLRGESGTRTCTHRFSTTWLQLGHSSLNLHRRCLAPLARGGRPAHELYREFLKKERKYCFALQEIGQ